MEGLNLGGFLFGNINEEGVLEDETLDEELRVALNTVSKKEAQRELGLGVDLNYFGIVKEDITISKEDENVKITAHFRSQDVRVDYSNIEEVAPDSPLTFPAETSLEGVAGLTALALSTSLIKSRVIREPKNAPVEPARERVKVPLSGGGSLRFTSFFSDRPAHGEDRYRARRLRMKRKKLANKPIVLVEDERDLFKSPINPLVKPLPTSPPPSLYQQLLASNLGPTGGRKKKPSLRLARLEEALRESSSASTSADRLVPDPAQLEAIEFNPTSYHPVEVIDWEKSIVWESSSTQSVSSTSRPSQLHLYAGSVTPIPSGQASRASSTHSFSRPTSPLPISLPPALRMPGSGAQSPLSSSASRVNTPIGVTAPKSLAGRITNVDFASGKWVEQILWDGKALSPTLPPTHLQLNLNDPYLIFENVDVSGMNEKLVKAEKLIHKRLKRLRHGVTSDGKAMVLVKFEKPVNDRFNLSNDKQYDGTLAPPSKGKDSGGSSATRQSNSTARHLISSRVSVQHSIPALKLSMPFYRTFWTKNELRTWHRPRLDTSLLVNRQLHLSKLKSQLNNEEATRRPTSSNARAIANSKKLSLRLGSEEFVLLEYSEEFPLLLSNVGMSSFLLNYYRKQNVKDSTNIECSFGVEKILEPNEASPFWIFGDVRPGETLATIQNNLFRAPLMEHQSQNCDFLLLKNNIKGQTESEWYVKNLPSSMLVVGQVLPTMEVFGPHSRKHNTFCRSRIQTFAYRLFKRDAESLNSEAADHRPRLKISRIMAAFPQFSEGSLRKWLKDYADSVRTGHDSGTWKMRTDAPVLSEDDIRALVTPEMICQYESMLAGQQRLNDAGFLDFAEVETAGEDGTESSITESESPEAKLAPWNLSANFISAVSGKCYLQLHGPGDPSGTGEAFSFVKGTPRQASHRSSGGEAANEAPPPLGSSKGKVPAEQIAYRQEIVQIWDAHIKFLKSLSPPEVVIDSQDGGTINDELSLFNEGNDADDDATSTTSRASTLKSSGRKLLIKRILRDDVTGEERMETETIDDPRLFSAYINQRRVWERKRRRRLIAAAASAARAKKIKPDGVNTPTTTAKSKTSQSRAVAGPPKPKKEVFVKCGTCGQIGHMRTNRICPQYAQYEAEVHAQESHHNDETPAAAPTISTKISISKSVLASVASAPVPPIKFKLPVAAIVNSTPRHDPEASSHTELPIILPLRASSPLLQYIPKPKKVKNLDSFPSHAQPLILKLSDQLLTIIDNLMKIPESWPFHKPVSKAEYPHYFKIVERPLDLGTIKARVRRHCYSSVEAFLDDIRLVRDNCLTFNGTEHVFSQTIVQLVEKVEGMASTPDLVELNQSIQAILGPKPLLDNADEVIIDDA